MKGSYDINPQEGYLQKGRDLPEKGRIYHSVIQYSGEVYLIGGQPGGKNKAKSKALSSVFVENKDGEWSALAAELNTARARHSTAIYEDKIWACGGRGGKNPNEFGSLLSCETFDGVLILILQY